ncbi:MAG: hypothetical protein U5K00_16005 [Melioribacteraceae bacterium]|nr:hypothetical protein [Melioribacteraceae bacterium]
MTLLKPVYKTNYFKNLKEKYSIELLHGPMTGAVTTSSIKIWLRTLNESEVEIKVFDTD